VGNVASTFTQLLPSASKYVYFTEDGMFTLDEDMYRSQHIDAKHYMKLKLPLRDNLQHLNFRRPLTGVYPKERTMYQPSSIPIKWL
jgi:hypothetical protein